MALIKTKYEKKSFIITMILSLLLLFLLFFFGLTYLDPPPENGIAVNFGTTETGAGQQQPTKPVKTAPQQNTSTPTPQPQETTPEVEEEVVTQETEEAPVIEEKEEKEKVSEEKKPDEEVKKPVETETPPKEIEEEPEPEPEPKPDKATSDAMNSILNGPENNGEETEGEGNDATGGDKGDPDGDPNASSYYGQGKGLDGDGNYRLGGRKALNKEKFVQDCNESGVVVVKIEVNQQGKVINAVPGVKGTTNTANCLLQPAKKAALATKFNSDADAPIKQTGYIEYEFKLSE